MVVNSNERDLNKKTKGEKPEGAECCSEQFQAAEPTVFNRPDGPFIRQEDGTYRSVWE